MVECIDIEAPDIHNLVDGIFRHKGMTWCICLPTFRPIALQIFPPYGWFHQSVVRGDDE